MELTGKRIWPGLGAVLAALGASLCCILPLVVAVLGVGSAAFAVYFEPVRAYLIALTVALLGFAFYQAYRPAKVECGPGETCAVPENRRTQRMIVWLVTVIVLALITFPYYVGWIL